MNGVIFDLDGVLVDSEPYWQRGFVEIATQYCLEQGLPDPGLTVEQMVRYQGGRVNDTIATILLSEAGHDISAEPATRAALTGRVIDHVAGLFAEHPTAIGSSVAVARELAERGVPMAVASSSAQQFIDAVLEATGLTDAFAVTQSALELEHGKPHPEVYLLTLERMGMDADEVVAIEDSTTGLGSALRAGLATIWLLRDAAESDAAALARLEESLAGEGDTTHLVRTITRELTVADVDAVLESL